MNFNEKLIELRKQKGLSQEELGDKLNVTRQTVSKWELGQTTPEMDKLVEMSKLFGVTLDQLTGNEEIKKEKNEAEEIKEGKVLENRKNLLIIILGVLIVIAVVIGIQKINEHKREETMKGIQSVWDSGINMVNDVKTQGDDLRETTTNVLNGIINELNEEQTNEEQTNNSGIDYQETINIFNELVNSQESKNNE